jgi:hypothetical protein
MLPSEAMSREIGGLRTLERWRAEPLAEPACGRLRRDRWATSFASASNGFVCEPLAQDTMPCTSKHGLSVP